MTMDDNDFDYDICLLSDKFHNDYNGDKYPELMSKTGRPYLYLIIKSHYDDGFIAIPYRSHIRHKNAFLFKNTERSKRDSSGLDFTKMILIKDPEYIQDKKPILDKDEFKATIRYIDKIISKATKYLDDYVQYKENININSRIAKKYMYSTLKYFI